MSHLYYVGKALLQSKLCFYGALSRALFFIIWGVLFAQDVVYSCPNCKDNFDLNGAQGGIGAAYGYTIYFMILLPIAIVATIVFKIRRQMQAHDKADFYRQIGDNVDANVGGFSQ